MHRVNANVAPMVENLIAQAAELQLGLSTLDNGCQLIDAGIQVPGCAEAGRLIAEICMGGLGRVQLEDNNDWPHCTQRVQVDSPEPIIACLASQYAGWDLRHGTGKQAFQALGSGPGRALGSREPLFEELGYRDVSDSACLVLEVDRPPPPELSTSIASQCGIDPERLSLILTPTTSIAGVVQIVARVLETALHKIHALEFPLAGIRQGSGHAPICPLTGDFMRAMGRTNDAILLAGEVTLEIDNAEDTLAELVQRLPSSASGDYGKPFADIFRDVEYDFYRIDPLLFSPARVTLISPATGKHFSAGQTDRQLLVQSFAG